MLKSLYLSQVNKSDKGTLEYTAKNLENLSEEEALKAALTLASVQKSTAGKTITKTNYEVFSGFKAVLNIFASSHRPADAEIS